MTKRLVTLGDLVVDLLLEAGLPLESGAHQMSQSLQFQPGGVGTTIFAARNLGLDVAALGAVGDDMQGQFLLRQLTDAGVDVSAVEQPAGSATTTVVAINDSTSQEHVFLGHYGVGPACEWTEAAADQLATADAVFIPGYSLVDERLNPLISGALDLLESSAHPLYVDVGPFMGRLPCEALPRLLRLTHTLLLTEDEIPFVTGGGHGVDALRALLDDNPEIQVVLKLGADGCRIMTKSTDLLCEGYAVLAIDSIGAGDAFAGAYIWARLHGFCLADCATIANAMGAASVMKAGAGHNAPTRAEVQSILDSNQTGIDLSCFKY